MRRLIAVATCLSLLTSCGGRNGSPSPSLTATGHAIDSAIVGLWHRAQSCDEMRAAFEAAGLGESHRESVDTNEVCVGAAEPLEHDHFFTADGQFGSHDENSEVVDGGDFAVVDDDTLAFPSHATEFGYDGDLVVGYAIANDVATFDVSLPETCVDSCADAYAWATSAFASGPWQSGGVP